MAQWMVFEALARRAYEREMLKRFAVVFVLGIALGAAAMWLVTRG